MKKKYFFIIGGSDHKWELDDTIFKYDPGSESWLTYGHMLEKRVGHGVSTIPYEDVKDYCNDAEHVQPVQTVVFVLTIFDKC